MGTNYYWEPVCPNCNQPLPDAERLHIGKSSAGWVFALHVYPEKHIDDLPDWAEWFRKGRIRNEYGDEIAPDRMLVEIACRSGRPGAELLSLEWLNANHASIGPFGLAQTALFGARPCCLGHGCGTYDRHIGTEQSW